MGRSERGPGLCLALAIAIAPSYLIMSVLCRGGYLAIYLLGAFIVIRGCATMVVEREGRSVRRGYSLLFEGWKLRGCC